MKKNLSLLLLLAVTTMLFVNCGGESPKKEAETVSKPDEVAANTTKEKKSREELIINRVEMSFADSANPNDFELKHTPEITIGQKNDDGKSQIIVKIGSKGIVHPSIEEHWIDFLTLYLDGVEHTHIEQPNDDKSNSAEFFAKLDGVKKLKVVAGCNLHGIWSNEIEL